MSDPVLEALDESRWHIECPPLGSLDPVIVRFDRVMDTALCVEEIGVLAPSGEFIPTRVWIARDGTEARLIPPRPWRSGDHYLVFSERLEDVCGNRLGEALDHDLGAGGGPRSGVIRFTAEPGSTALSPSQTPAPLA